MEPFEITRLRLSAVENSLEDQADSRVDHLKGSLKESEQAALAESWRHFLLFFDPRSYWLLQQEAYAGLLSEGVNFAFRDGNPITNVSIAVDLMQREVVVSYHGVNWNNASGLDLYLAARKFSGRKFRRDKSFGPSFEKFVNSVRLTEQMLNRDKDFPFAKAWDNEVLSSMFADRSFRGLRRSALRNAAKAMIHSIILEGASYREPGWMNLIHVDSHNKSRGWQNLCSEWYFLMIDSDVESAIDHAVTFSDKMSKLGQDSLVLSRLKSLTDSVK